jgi:acetoin utilization protein AcuC
MSRTVVVHSERLAQYKAYEGYPWLFERSQVAFDLFRRHGLLDLPGVEVRTPELAPVDALRSYHTQEYLDALELANTGTFEEWMLGIGLGTLECPVYPGCFDYHRLVAGCTLAGAAALEEPDVTFAMVPSGGMHHAGPDFASGFCYINDPVLAIHRLLEQGKRVLYLDLDAHHGNLVQEAFYGESRVLKISIHESPETLFPFHTGFVHETGEGPGEGYNVNVPLAAGTSDEVYGLVFNRIVPPLVDAFGPDIVVSVIGADVLSADPLTHLMLTTAGYCNGVGWLRSCGRKALILGGGGYLADSVARALTLAWATLNDVPLCDDAELLFGGMFRGDGLSSLHDLPIYIPEETLRLAREACRPVIEFIEQHQFATLGARPAEAAGPGECSRRG